MSEHEVIARTHEPITVMTLVTHLAACGLREGQTVLVHTRLSALGWVVGGAQAVIQALLQVLGPTGTVMMPTQTWKNLDPFSGVHGHVPESWWPTIRAHWPAYDPATTPYFAVLLCQGIPANESRKALASKPRIFRLMLPFFHLSARFCSSSVRP